MTDRSDWWRPGGRPAVQVISIARPALPLRPNYGVAIGAAGLAFFGLGSLIAGLKALPAVGWMILFVVQAGVCGFFAWLLWRAFFSEYQAIQKREREPPAPPPAPIDAEDAIAQTIQRKWTLPDSPPKPGVVLAAVRGIEGDSKTSARLVCLNVPEIPPADHYRFEPEVFPPIRSLAFFLWFAGAGAAVMVAWAIQFVPGVPWRFSLLSVPCFVIPAFVFGVMALWALWIRPQYVRCAPGVIQFLRYSWRGGPPVVRSYPVTPGTLVVASRKGKELTVTLFRGGLKDTLALGEMTRATEAEEIVWKALRSTAPIPAMHEAELLG